jgi:hypothetical protein
VILDLDDERKSVQTIHPALDMADGVVYAGVRVQQRSKQHAEDFIFTSRGEVLTTNELAEQGLVPQVELHLGRESVRWNNQAITAFQQASLQTPSWEETYWNIHATFTELLQVCDKRYLVVLTHYAMMTYFCWGHPRAGRAEPHARWDRWPSTGW